MKCTSESSRLSGSSYFKRVTLTLLHIRDTRASGRLSLHNSERFGLAHLYFRKGSLVHIAGDKRDGEAVLQDVLTWSKGHVRFDREVFVEYRNVTWQETELFMRWLMLLEMHAVVHGVARSRVEGLARGIAACLPHRPIALPHMIENYEEHKENLRSQQRLQFSRSVQRFIELSLPQVLVKSLLLIPPVSVQQVGTLVQELTGRAAKAMQEGTRQAALFVEELLEAIGKAFCQQYVHSAHDAVQSVERSVVHSTGQIPPTWSRDLPIHSDPCSTTISNDEL